MKLLNQTIKLSILLLITFLFQSSAYADNIVGTWIYEASGTPYEYSKGEIMITNDQDTYQVMVAVNYSNIKGQDVKVDKDKITFNIYVEDEKINVMLKIEGDQLTGEASSYDGIFKLTGKRK
jgi:hypothetical protein